MHLPPPPLPPYLRQQDLQLPNLPAQEPRENSNRDPEKAFQHRQQRILARFPEFLIRSPGPDGKFEVADRHVYETRFLHGVLELIAR